MAFSSIIFLFYFLPLFFLIYYSCPQKLKNPILLLGSIFFYSWGSPIFIFIILFTTFLDFFLVKAMHQSKNRKWIFLVISLTINLGLLFYFKYFNFFIDNFNGLTSIFGVPPVFWEKIILPIGISFYTFESLTYIIDVYRKEHKPLNNFWDYQLYILLFPKLIAGPIVRYSQISDQINHRFKSDNIQNRLAGLMRFIIGLAKKVLIANVLGETADGIYETLSPEQQTTSLLWIASFAYTFQIYFDFSGYTDMAIGLCLMLGFRIPENFNFPYISASITEFWRRWHISLGSWMKNYIYIPLGGNKISVSRGYINLSIVFLISGFWHGASWNFIIWGLFHGVFMIAERFFILRYTQKLPRIIKVIFVLFIINISWVIFRTENLEDLKTILTQMFTFYNNHSIDYDVTFKFYCILFLALILSMTGLIKRWEIFTQDSVLFYTGTRNRTMILTLLCFILLIISLANVVGSNFNPFIYFRF